MMNNKLFKANHFSIAKISISFSQFEAFFHPQHSCKTSRNTSLLFSSSQVKNAKKSWIFHKKCLPIRSEKQSLSFHFPKRDMAKSQVRKAPPDLAKSARVAARTWQRASALTSHFSRIDWRVLTAFKRIRLAKPDTHFRRGNRSEEEKMRLRL